MSEYRYRIDSLRGLQGMRDCLRARRWGDFPHRSLIAARRGLPGDHGIYRLSFWRSLEIAQAHLLRLGNRQLVTRVRHATVMRYMSGWTHEEDDHLPGQADLIWKVAPLTDEVEGFHRDGIPLSELEVLHNCCWTPWHECQLLWPEALRLQSMGWSPHWLSSPHAWPRRIFWKLELAAPVAPWPVLVLLQDRQAGGLHLANDDAGMHQLLRELAGAAQMAGALPSRVVMYQASDTGEPMVLTAQRAVAWSRPKGTVLGRLLRTNDRPPRPELHMRDPLSAERLSTLAVAAGLHVAGIMAAHHWMDPVHYR